MESRKVFFVAHIDTQNAGCLDVSPFKHGYFDYLCQILAPTTPALIVELLLRYPNRSCLKGPFVIFCAPCLKPHRSNPRPSCL